MRLLLGNRSFGRSRQWANRSGLHSRTLRSHAAARRRWPRNRLFLRIAHRTIGPVHTSIAPCHGHFVHISIISIPAKPDLAPKTGIFWLALGRRAEPESSELEGQAGCTEGDGRQSSPEAQTAWQAITAPPGREAGVHLRPPARNWRPAPCSGKWPGGDSKMDAPPRGHLQPWVSHPQVLRPGHTEQYAGPRYFARYFARYLGGGLRIALLPLYSAPIGPSRAELRFITPQTRFLHYDRARAPQSLSCLQLPDTPFPRTSRRCQRIWLPCHCPLSGGRSPASA